MAEKKTVITEKADAQATVKDKKIAEAAPGKPATAKKKAVTKKTTTTKTAVKTGRPKKTSSAANKEKTTKAVAKKTTAKKTVKKTAARAKATEIKTSVVLQYGDQSITYSTIEEIAKKQIKPTPKKLDLYVKPQDGKVYWVADDKKVGDFNL